MDAEVLSRAIFRTFYHDCRSETAIIEATTATLIILQPQTSALTRQSAGSCSNFVLSLGVGASTFVIKLPAVQCRAFHSKDLLLLAMALTSSLMSSKQGEGLKRYII